MKGIEEELEQWSKSPALSGEMYQLATGFSAKAAKTDPLPVDYFQTETSFTPAVKPFIFTKDVLFKTWAWLQTSDPLYIFGPTGCGKSATVEQLAARLRIPLFNLVGSFDTDVADLYGSRTATNGTVYYEYGLLALAYKYGGWFLLDELDGLNPALALGLNTVLEGRPLVLPESGEIIRRHPRFRFIATANTNGGSDDTGVYQGTQRMNLAFMDRFIKIEAQYPSKEVEKVLLLQFAPEIPLLHDKMIAFANLVRGAFLNPDAGTQLDVTMSSRSLLRWAELIKLFSPKRKEMKVTSTAMLMAVGYMASAPCRVSLLEMLQRVFGGEANADDNNS
jgi:cobaltochelatase CobS